MNECQNLLVLLLHPCWHVLPRPIAPSLKPVSAAAPAGLAKNECLARRPAGARLLQVGEQSLAMGLKFRARVVLDIEEHPSGLAPHLISDEVPLSGVWSSLGVCS